MVGWAVELRPTAPGLCTYMAWQAPAFVLNTAKARHLNIAHGLYPRPPLDDKTLAAMISGDRSRPRNWSITALSISAAGMRRTGHESASRLSTSVET
jgi:hypothetical protein